MSNQANHSASQPEETQYRVNLKVDGQARTVVTEARTSLLTLLRESLHLTGTKRGCEEGECGSCSVILNGRLTQACLVFGVEAEGAEITTVEGLGQPHHLGPVQQAFGETGASQCGFCIPGMLLATEVLLEDTPNPTEETVRRALSGNLCRCTGYDRIVQGVLRAAELKRGASRS